MKLLDRRSVDLGAEEGAAVVEMAIVAMLLFTLLFGIIEFGLAFKDRLTVSNSSQAAARVATGIGGTTPFADFLVVETLRNTLSAGVTPDTIEEVWIYRANADGEPVNAFDESQTNQYTYNPVNPACPWSPCPDPNEPGGGHDGWDPASRLVDVSNLDVVGVKVFYKHDWITGFLGIDDVGCDAGRDPATNELVNCWSDTAVLRMEPQTGG